MKDKNTSEILKTGLKSEIKYQINSQTQFKHQNTNMIE